MKQELWMKVFSLNIKTSSDRQSSFMVCARQIIHSKAPLFCVSDQGQCRRLTTSQCIMDSSHDSHEKVLSVLLLNFVGYLLHRQKKSYFSAVFSLVFLSEEMTNYRKYDNGYKWLCQTGGSSAEVNRWDQLSLFVSCYRAPSGNAQTADCDCVALGSDTLMHPTICEMAFVYPPCSHPTVSHNDATHSIARLKISVGITLWHHGNDCSCLSDFSSNRLVTGWTNHGLTDSHKNFRVRLSEKIT